MTNEELQNGQNLFTDEELSEETLTTRSIFQVFFQMYLQVVDAGSEDEDYNKTDERKTDKVTDIKANKMKKFKTEEIKQEVLLL